MKHFEKTLLVSCVFAVACLFTLWAGACEFTNCKRVALANGKPGETVLVCECAK